MLSISYLLVRSLYFFFSFLQAERRALDAKQEFDQVSRLVKSEVARFEQERIEDFKNSLEAFLDGMISRQKEVRSIVTGPMPRLTIHPHS